MTTETITYTAITETCTATYGEWTGPKADAIARAVDELDAEVYGADGNGEWTYYAEEAAETILVDEDEMAELGAALLSGETMASAYSIWCSTNGRTLDPHDAAAEAAAEIVATEAVVLETMPGWMRASHEAAGGTGAYPANGATRYIVGREAAEALIAADEWARIVRPAKATDFPHYTMDISGEQAEAEA